jgi:hypothetical protein
MSSMAGWRIQGQARSFMHVLGMESMLPGNAASSLVSVLTAVSTDEVSCIEKQ